MSRPEGQALEDAPEAYWFKCDMDAWALVRDLLPRPWPVALCMQDLRYLEARERYRRAARDGQTALQVRWGVSASTVKRYLAAARAKAGPALDQPWTKAEPSEPHQHAIADDERTSPGPALDQPWTKAEPVASENPQQVQLLEAPKSESETEKQNTNKPAKAGGVSLDDIQSMLDEMHAIAKAVDPGARRQSAEELAPAVLRTLKDLAPLAKSRKTTTRAIIIDIWQWWWNGDNPWYRENRRAGVGYTTLFRPANARKYLTESQGWRDARYIPTADEALDAVIEVGCSGAEARYPAAARAIRQTFDFEMSGDLARMRNHPDPAKVRARWSAGYAKYLTPKPTLALVAR